MNILRAALLAIVLATLSGLAHSEHGYRLTDIGTIGFNTVIPEAINNRGHVTGGNFLYRNGEMESLGALLGAGGSAVDINDRDQITGLSTELPGGQLRAFLYHQGSAEALGPPGLELAPHAINNRGHVVGVAVYDLFNRRAFVHRRGSLVDLGTLGGSLSTALAINDAGTIVGVAEIRRGVFHPFAYSRGEMMDLADLLGSTAGPAAINDTGDIAGIAVEPSADGEPRQVLFLYAKGRRIELGALPGAEFYGVRGLNNRREVVGYASIAGSLTGIHYRRGALRELNDLVDPSDPLHPYVDLHQGVDINDRGQIVARGLDNRIGFFHGYILTPRSLPRELLQELLQEALAAELGHSYVSDLRRAAALLAASKEKECAAALWKFIERVRTAPRGHIAPRRAHDLIRDAQLAAEILRSW